MTVDLLFNCFESPRHLNCPRTRRTFSFNRGPSPDTFVKVPYQVTYNCTQ
jgi:hypothetical protein